jgi:bifunctional oligoribonuclease and PAP phosphatase NrnA
MKSTEKEKAVVNSMREIAAELQKGGPVLLTAHIMPDGDSIGSLLGLGLSLRAAGSDITMFSADDVPARYTFLHGSHLIKTQTLPEAAYTRVVVLDCSDHQRIRPIWDKVKDKFIINIDHHPTNDSFGTMNYIDSAAGATGEIVYFLLQEMGLKLTPDVAAALYVAIATDTGSFKFENTTPRTHRVCAALLEAGVKPQDISPLVFDLRSREAIFILRAALASLRFSPDGKVAWMVLNEEDMQESGAKDEHLEGAVNFAKNIEGVEVGLLFRAKGDGTVKVGLRSHSMDVGSVAQSLGGGGHARAAGCSLEAGTEEAVDIVMNVIKAKIKG